jgi:hypothetical protein
MPVDGQSLSELLSGLLPIVQTVVALILGVISKLLRDIRNELLSLDKRLAQTEVFQRELEKRLVDSVHDIRREQDILRAHVDRARNDGR